MIARGGFGAVDDLGLGGMLGQQAQDETEEQRKKRLMLQQQQQAGLASPATVSLLGPGYGLAGIGRGR